MYIFYVYFYTARYVHFVPFLCEFRIIYV